MDITKGLHTKTTLEHLIFLSNKNIVSVCKELQITPQQFSDWIKNRRPIPTDRLEQLVEYFQVPEEMLVDRKFARRLSALTAVELEMVVAANRLQCCANEEKEELNYRLDCLKAEREKQIRIARLTAILEENEPVKMDKIDAFLNKLEEK